MKNTPEEKERFFAQYWGQEVKTSDYLKSYGFKPLTVNYRNIKRAAVSYLELTPLSLITGEDAIELAKLNNWQHPVNDLTEVYVNSLGDKVVKTSLDLKYGYFVIKEDNFNPHQFDFLRSKGYALSYNGISVEEQIEFGWTKLKEENKQKC